MVVISEVEVGVEGCSTYVVEEEEESGHSTPCTETEETIRIGDQAVFVTTEEWVVVVVNPAAKVVCQCPASSSAPIEDTRVDSEASPSPPPPRKRRKPEKLQKTPIVRVPATAPSAVLGTNKHHCTACNKNFALVSIGVEAKAEGSIWRSASRLKRHERIHTGERPFKCSYCDKTFTQTHVRKTHEVSHTGNFPYLCIYCPKMFAKQEYLKEHERIHTGERPFQCSFCPKAFTQRTSRKLHEKKHEQNPAPSLPSKQPPQNPQAEPRSETKNPASVSSGPPQLYREEPSGLLEHYGVEVTPTPWFPTPSTSFTNL